MTGAQEQLQEHPREPTPTKEEQSKTTDPAPLSMSASTNQDDIAAGSDGQDIALQPTDTVKAENPAAEHVTEPNSTETQLAKEAPEPLKDGPETIEAASSQFVTRLRGEVALSRNVTWDENPSVACYTPRGKRKIVAPSSEVTSAESGSSAGPTELRVKGSGLKPFKLEGLPSGITVWDVKALSQRFCNMAADEQKLLHKGKILHDSQTLEELNISSGAQLFLVRGAPPSNGAASSSQAAQSNVSAPTRESDDQAHDLLDPWDDRLAFEDMDDEQLLHALMMGRLCRACGVNPGRLQTDGLCSVCFREIMMREHWLLKEKKKQEDAKKQQEVEAAKQEEERRRREEFERRQKDKTRCKMCNKKHGLTGFMCRCGFYFCSTHRYAEDHGCTFDHQAHGREILTQQNPGV